MGQRQEKKTGKGKEKDQKVKKKMGEVINVAQDAVNVAEFHGDNKLCSLHADITNDVRTDWRCQQLSKDLERMKQRVTLQEMIAAAVTTVTTTHTVHG